MRAYLRINGVHATEVVGLVGAELPLTIHVNGQRFVTLLCSPFQVEALTSAQADKALKLVLFILSAEGQEELARHGFSAPTRTTP